MKKRINLLAICMLAICGVFVISCNQDEDYDEDFHDLDVIRYTTVAKTAQFEPGATQSFYNNNHGTYDEVMTVPTYESECMLWSIITVAINNNTKFEVTKKNGNTKYYKIGYDYPASKAYESVKQLAQGQTWREDGEDHIYTNGSMPPSIAANIAKKAGIMEGITRKFDTYQELFEFISNPSWAEKHPDGTYIICNDKLKHASVCNGTKKDIIRLEINIGNSSEQPENFNTADNSKDGFTLIY